MKSPKILIIDDEEAIRGTLKDILESDENDRDILVATVHGIRMLGLRPGSYAKSRRLFWQALETLHTFGQNERRAPDLVRSHVPAAIASLVGRTASTDATRFKRLFLRTLHDSKSDQLLEQSAALALGGPGDWLFIAALYVLGRGDWDGFRWAPDSFAFWDNRAAQHYAAADYWPETRRMERVTIIGDRPT